MPPLFEQCPRALPGLSVDQVEYHIEIFCDLLEWLLLVVDHDVRAQTAGEIDVVREDRSRHMESAGFCELNCEVSDAAGSTVNKDSLSWFHLSISKKSLPRGLTRKRNGRGLDMIERLRLPGDRVLAQ